MCIFFGSDVSKESLDLSVRHRVALIEVTQGSCKLSVRTAKLRNYHLSEFGIRCFDINGILKFFLILPHTLAPFPRPRIVDPVPVLRVVVLFRFQGTVLSRKLIHTVLAELFVVIEKAESAAAVRVGVEIEVEFLESRLS